MSMGYLYQWQFLLETFTRVALVKRQRFNFNGKVKGTNA
jgi:hypothetical protein